MSRWKQYRILFVILAGGALLHLAIRGVETTWGSDVATRVRIAGSGVVAAATLAAFLWLRSRGLRVLALLAFSLFFLWDALSRWSTLG